MKHLLRNAMIATSLVLAGFMVAMAWLRPHLPFLNLYTDGTGERSGSSQVRYAVWERPEPIGAPTNSSDTETRPTLSYSGEWMFYEVGEVGANADIWIAPIVDGRAQPGHPATGLNSSADDIGPCCDDGRYLYFASNREGGRGGFDLYRAPIEASGVGTPELVPGNVNSPANEIDPAVRPGQLALFFVSDRAQHGAGDHDIYRAEPSGDGFTNVRPVKSLNSDADEREPAFSPDGMIVFFASNRRGGLGGYDLWRSLDDQGTFLPPENVTSLNSPADDRAPFPAAEGFSVLFASNREGSLGNLDIHRAATRELFMKPLRPLGLSDLTYAALLLLAALLAYMARRFESLDLLAKCLLLSLILHFFAMLWFRRVEVGTGETQPVAAPATFKIRLRHDEGGGVTEGGGGGGGGRDDSFHGKEAKALEHAFGRVAAGLPQDAAAPDASLGGGLAAASERQADLTAPGLPDRSGAVAPAQGTGASEVSPELGFSEERPLARAAAPGLAVSASALSSATGSDRGTATAPAPSVRAAGSTGAGSSGLREASPVAMGLSGTGGSGAAGRPLPEGPSSSSSEALVPGQPGAPSGAAIAAPADSTPRTRLSGGGGALELLPAPVAAAAGGGGGTGHEPSRQPSRAEGLGGGSGGSGVSPSRAPAARAGDAAWPTSEEGTGASGWSGGHGSAAGDRLPGGLGSAPRAVSLTAPAETRAAPLGQGDGNGPGNGTGEGGGAGLGAGLEPSRLASSGSRVELPRRGGATSGGGTATGNGSASGNGGAGAGATPGGSPLPGRAASVGSLADLGSGGDRGSSTGPTASGPAFGTKPGPAAVTPLPAEPGPIAGGGSGGSGGAETSGAGAASGAGEALVGGPANLGGGPRTLALPERARTSVADLAPAPAPAAIASAARTTSELPTPPPAPTARDLGVYSRRFGTEKDVAIKTFGGSEETEHAVAQGLKYLASIQARDGHWGSSDDDDQKYGQVMIGKSALCLLAFLGAGHTPASSTAYSDVARRAVQFLLSVQEDHSGHFGYTSAYSHGIATYALAECYAITHAPELREPIERAVDHILSQQHQNRRDANDHGGWGYFYPDGRVFDRWPRASITAWQVMALKSARLSGIDVPQEVFDDARSFLEHCWDQKLGAFRYNHDPSRLRSSYSTLPGSTPAALFALSLIGDTQVNPRALEGGLSFVRERQPSGFAYRGDDAFVQRAAGNLYFWYYGTLATFVKGGDAWDQWNSAMKATLVPAQQPDGSWKPICLYARYAGDDENDHSYTTSMCVLMLEVYYRYFTPLLKAAGSG